MTVLVWQCSSMRVYDFACKSIEFCMSTVHISNHLSSVLYNSSSALFKSVRGQWECGKYAKSVSVKFIVKGSNGSQWCLTTFNELSLLVRPCSSFSIEQRMLSVPSCHEVQVANVIKGINLHDSTVIITPHLSQH